MSGYKLQTPGNYPKESIQYIYCINSIEHNGDVAPKKKNCALISDVQDLAHCLQSILKILYLGNWLFSTSDMESRRAIRRYIHSLASLQMYVSE